MGFSRIADRWDAAGFAIGVGWRALALAGLGLGIVSFLFLRPAYASAAALSGAFCLVLLDLARFADKADRISSRFISSLAAGDPEYPPSREGGSPGLRRLGRAMRDFALGVSEARRGQLREIEYLRSVIDTTAAGLLAIASDGQVVLLNRAARALSAQGALSAEACDELESLEAGMRRVCRLSDGRRALAIAADFAAEGRQTKLFSLQSIDTELDAAETKAWRDLTRILAHEMMNSLTPVVSVAESLRPLLNHPSPEIRGELINAVDVIRQRSLGLMSFIERYRVLAELPRPALSEVQIDDLFDALERLLAADLSARGIELSRIAPEDLRLAADPELLEQALLNLLRNAIDAVAAVPHPKIDLLAEENGDSVELSVIDNGEGVDFETLNRIFVPFFTTKPNGSGVGLSLTRQITAAHGGRIEAALGASGGMIFKMTLPKKM